MRGVAGAEEGGEEAEVVVVLGKTKMSILTPTITLFLEVNKQIPLHFWNNSFSNFVLFEIALFCGIFYRNNRHRLAEQQRL